MSLSFGRICPPDRDRGATRCSAYWTPGGDQSAAASWTIVNSRDIGLTRSQIEDAVGGPPIRTLGDGCGKRAVSA